MCTSAGWHVRWLFNTQPSGIMFFYLPFILFFDCTQVLLRFTKREAMQCRTWPSSIPISVSLPTALREQPFIETVVSLLRSWSSYIQITASWSSPVPYKRPLLGGRVIIKARLLTLLTIRVARIGLGLLVCFSHGNTTCSQFHPGSSSSTELGLLSQHIHHPFLFVREFLVWCYMFYYVVRTRHNLGFEK